MKSEWKNAFPKKPEEFHDKLMDTLNNLPDERKVVMMKKKRYLGAAAAAVALLGTLSVYAAVTWNDRTAEHFKADEIMQTKLNEENYSSQAEQTVTDDDITVTLKQTLQDNNLIYLLFHVTGQENITEDNIMKFDLVPENKDDLQISGMEWGFVDQFSQPEITTSRDFEIWIHKGTNFDSKSMSLLFTGYGSGTPKAGPDIVSKEGNWPFTIDTLANDTATYDINKVINVANCNITVSKLELSPISYTIYYEAEGVKALEKATGISIDQLDTLTSLTISGIKYEDENLITEEYNEMSAGYENNYYSSTGRLSEVIDTNQLKSILIGNEPIEIPINRN